MFNIVENPQTKELFLAGYSGGIAFDGTPYCLDVTGWAVVGQAPHAEAWFSNPGDYSTLYGSMSVAMLDGDKWLQFEMGDNIAWLRNWLRDASATNTVTVANQRAYSSRNIARSKATH